MVMVKRSATTQLADYYTDIKLRGHGNVQNEKPANLQPLTVRNDQNYYNQQFI